MIRDLDAYVQQYRKLPFESVQEKYRIKRLLEVLNRLKQSQNFSNILEVGPGVNPVFEQFASFNSYTIIEPIKYFSELLEVKNSKIVVINQTLEDFLDSDRDLKFDLVILSSVLHETVNPDLILKKLVQATTQYSKIVVVLPNNISLHRIIGEFAGIQKAGPYLTDTERRMQQGISYSTDTFTLAAQKAGLKVLEIFTSFIKPFPHFKMHELQLSGEISDSDFESLYSLSKLLQPYGSEIFAILGKNDD